MVDSHTSGLIFSGPQRSVSRNRSNFTRADLPRVSGIISPTASSYGYCDTPIPKYGNLTHQCIRFYTKMVRITTSLNNRNYN